MILSLLNICIYHDKIKIEQYFYFITFIISLKQSNEISNLYKEALNLDDDVLTYTEFRLKVANRKRIEEVLDPLYKYYLSLEKQQNQLMKEKNKQIYCYTELLEILKREDSKEEITCIDLILDRIKEDDLKILCLKYIEQHNKIYYEKLEQEYSYKNENSISKYISYFNEMGIDFKSLTIEEQQMVMRDSLQVLKEKIKLLETIFQDNQLCVLTAIKTELSVVEEIDHLMKKGYISQELLLNDPTLYYDTYKLTNLKDNIEFLLKEKVNLISIEDKSFLMIDTSLLIKNVKVLKKLDIEIKNLKDLKMLTEEKLQDKINSLIEIGLEEVLVKKPVVLNSDINLAKRIVIARLVGEDIFEDDEIKESILDKDKFFVADNMINKYLLDRDNSNYQSSAMIELRCFNETKASYLLEGVIIPKAKVTNLCVSLEALIKPSLYSEQEVKVLEKYQKVEK